MICCTKVVLSVVNNTYKLYRAKDFYISFVLLHPDKRSKANPTWKMGQFYDPVAGETLLFPSHEFALRRKGQRVVEAHTV